MGGCVDEEEEGKGGGRGRGREGGGEEGGGSGGGGQMSQWEAPTVGAWLSENMPGHGATTCKAHTATFQTHPDRNHDCALATVPKHRCSASERHMLRKLEEY